MIRSAGTSPLAYDQTAVRQDVAVGNPFCGAVTWLHNTGITQGFTDGGFQPATDISRQAMAAFLYRLHTQP